MAYNNKPQQRPALFGKSALAEQLHEATGRPFPQNNRRQDNIFDPLPTNPNQMGDDGTDHILIAIWGKTKVGRLLAMDYHDYKKRFNHNLLGDFITLQNFYDYVKSKERDDRIRYMRKEVLKEFRFKCTKILVPHFKAIIMDAYWQKINASSELKELVKESTLPFEMYRTNHASGFRTRWPDSYWIQQGLDEIRKALKENRAPDLRMYMDNTDNTIEEIIRKEFSIRPPEPRREFKPKKEHVDQEAAEEKLSADDVDQKREDQAVSQNLQAPEKELCVDEDMQANKLPEEEVNNTDEATPPEAMTHVEHAKEEHSHHHHHQHA